MPIRPLLALLAGLAVLAGCSGNTRTTEEQLAQRDAQVRREFKLEEESFFDLFRNQPDPERGVVVNRYLWQASLDTLSFLPLESADPFSGLITTDWGRIAGASGVYRVTVYISDPALDARSLKVAAFRQQGGRGVAIAEDQNRALENAILTRARQMRIAAAQPDRGVPQERAIGYAPAGGL